MRTALWVRDAVTYALMSVQAAGHDSTEEDTEDEVASWVAASEADHTEVYQAVGMVMVQLDLDPEQALDRLRARAYAEGRTVSQLAREVLARRLRFRKEPEADPDDGGDRRHYAGEDGRDGGDEGRDGER
ncbi:ANTAR domain-containing protein [Streptomyces sp. NPDC003233]